MSLEDYLTKFRARGLLAWQAGFAASFLEHGSAASHLLTGPTGTGKTQAAIAVVAEFAAEPSKRILILTPAPLSAQWQMRLVESQSGLPALQVTKQRLREMEASAPIGRSPWEPYAAYIVSQDVAKQSEFATSLSAVPWDLVVVDEAHRMVAPQRAALLDRLVAAGVVHRLLLVSSTPLPMLEPWLRPSSDQPSRFPMDTVVTSWYGALTDWGGVVVQRPRAEWKAVHFRRNEDEVRALSQFLESAAELEDVSGGNSYLVELLKHRASSSLFAFEQSMRRLAHTLRSTVENGEILSEKNDFDMTSSSMEATGPAIQEKRFEWKDKKAGLAIVERCLETLETVRADEKLAALKRLLSTITRGAGEAFSRICICSMYADTVAYLHAALDDLGLPLFKITGASNPNFRKVTITQFFGQEGILLATDGSLEEGTSMSEVSHLIQFDLPTNPIALEQRRGRFDRYGRKTILRAFAFRDESEILPFEADLIDAVSANPVGDVDAASNASRR